MQCDYFDAHQCRSCNLMGIPYAVQLADKQAHVERDLAEVIDAGAWLPAQPSREQGFRNKAKLVVGGIPGEVTLGILDTDRRGVDLRHCGLYVRPLSLALPVIAQALNEVRVLPYDVAKARGELKFVLITCSSTGELMVRFVLRSDRQLRKIQAALELIQGQVASVVTASVNLQPAHKAVLEGDTEIALTEQRTLAMPVNDITLHLGAQSFFQTNTDVAAALYRQARAWVSALAPHTVWDLYCGVGGFGLHVAAPGREIIGVEVSPEAISSARRSAGPGSDFRTGDATAFALDHESPDVIIVNPPRRGLDVALTTRLQQQGPRHVVYSSCNATSLARDLAALPAYAVTQARRFDMFPQTAHHEVAVVLTRT